MSPITEIKRIHSSSLQPKRQRLKPRRVRRQEERDRIKAGKVNQKKNDRLSV